MFWEPGLKPYRLGGDVQVVRRAVRQERVFMNAGLSLQHKEMNRGGYCLPLVRSGRDSYFVNSSSAVRSLAKRPEPAEKVTECAAYLEPGVDTPDRQAIRALGPVSVDKSSRSRCPSERG